MAATALGKVRLTEEALQKLVLKAREWALLHGVQMVPEESLTTCSRALYAPMTLFPSPMPRAVMQQGKQLQRDYNRLMHAVAHDHDFLKESLKNVIKVDSFTKMLWEIYCTVREEGLAQPISLGLFRNDFMLDTCCADCEASDCRCRGFTVDGQRVTSDVCLKQIEFNTIASSFGGLAGAIWNVHRYTMAHAGIQFTDDQIPDNQPALGLARGMAKAWELYGEKKAVILMVVQQGERNRMDQLWLEKKLFEVNREIPVVFATLQELYDHSELTENKRLYLHGREVAVIYLRDGYSPDHYPSNKETEVRLRFERSRAIKCPSVHYQLAGCKKIQQTLASPDVVERFIRDQHVCRRIRETFAGQYTLDRGEIGDNAIALAMNAPDKFVCKPQREGGGNNIYGSDICVCLKKMIDSDERSAFILMERIFPWPQKNHLLKDGRDYRLRNVISELGIYGVYIGSSTEELMNEEVGHLLRTKTADDNEGGIVAGFATIDSPFLVESTDSYVDS